MCKTESRLPGRVDEGQLPAGWLYLGVWAKGTVALSAALPSSVMACSLACARQHLEEIRATIPPIGNGEP